jgi:hypothetical protein
MMSHARDLRNSVPVTGKLCVWPHFIELPIFKIRKKWK